MHAYEILGFTNVALPMTFIWWPGGEERYTNSIHGICQESPSSRTEGNIEILAIEGLMFLASGSIMPQWLCDYAIKIYMDVWCQYFIDLHLYGFHSCINILLWRNDEIGLRKNVIHMNIPDYYITIINSREDAFTTFEIKTWLPDFILGINLFRICCDWPIWEEVTCYLGNNKVIHFLLIDRQLNIRTTPWPKLGTNTKKVVEDWE